MYRFFEILPGALAWLTLFLIVLFSWRLPVFASIFIILFDVYWLLKTIYLSLHLRSTFSAMKKNLKVNWLEKLKELDRDANDANAMRIPRIKGKDSSRSDSFVDSHVFADSHREISWQDIYHLVILPMYREPYEVVRESFQSLVRANYPKDKFIVVLATEQRALRPIRNTQGRPEGDNAQDKTAQMGRNEPFDSAPAQQARLSPRLTRVEAGAPQERRDKSGQAGGSVEETAEKIRQEFSSQFFKFLITTHPADLPGEIPGKGSNETWAVKEAKRLIIDPLINTQTNAERTQTNAEILRESALSLRKSAILADGTQTNAEKEFLYADLTYKIRGAVFSVKKKLGLGHKEVVYQRALEEEFTRLGLNFEKEKVIEILYEDKKIGIYRPDFVVENKVILELKALPFINKVERRQIWQYLQGSSYKLALLINFGGNDVYVKRIVYDTARELPRKSASSQRESALKYENILVSVFDIDTQIFPEYFGRLTYVFLRASNRLRAIYQPIPLFTNNIYRAPALARVIAFSSTFWQMMQQARSERLTSFSSQSLPLSVLLDIGFWHTDVVSEDSRIFWQGYLRYHGDFRVEPLLYPVSMDANVAPGFWQTMKNNYRQHRRWAWGSENIPYMLCGAERAPSNEGFLYDSQIPRWKKWYWSFNVIEGFHSWATNSLMIFALGWLPVLMGGRHFNASLLSYSLPQITKFIIQLSMIGVASSAIVSILLLPPRPEWFRWYHYFLYVLQWMFIPVTLIVFGAFPALEAETRLALGGKWRLGFWATPKDRRGVPQITSGQPQKIK